MNLVAAIQMASGPNVQANLSEAERLIAEAVKAGAGLVVLPENFALMGMSEGDVLKIQQEDGNGPVQEFLASQARLHGIWLVGGTVPMRNPGSDKVSAACMLYDDRGERVARYDKIHLFDVELEESGESYNESATFKHGSDIVVVDTPFGKLGLAVCYDLRFPELFRGMLDRGVEIVALPSAFTSITGKAHWESLIRARAIENLIYVVAAAQGGYHVSGRETFGDSMIVDPWGTVLQRLPRGAGVVLGQVDLDRLHRTRRSFPTIAHRRLTCKIA